jgi:membrane-bound serine protease (ClpP class)
MISRSSALPVVLLGALSVWPVTLPLSTTSYLAWMDQAASLMASPLVAPVLLCLGFLGLLAEIRTPTFGMAGTAGLLALGLFFGSHVLAGLAGVGDIVIVGVGLVLLGLEIFVVPGFMVVGVVGVVIVLTGIYLSLLGPDPSAGDLVRAGLVLATAVVVTLLIAWALLRSLPPDARPGAGGIFLPHRAASAVVLGPLHGGRGELLGRKGAAITDLRPAGTALFEEERLNVVAESGWIPAGTRIRIVSAEGYRRIVRPLDPGGQDQPEGDADRTAGA